MKSHHSRIHRVFLMHFDLPALVVIDFLSKPKRRLDGIHLLEIAGVPTQAARYMETVVPSPVRQFVPLAELLFVLEAGAHGQRK